MSSRQGNDRWSRSGRFTRRDVLRLGALGLSLPQWLALQAAASPPADRPGAVPRFGQARSCIVLFAWGGMSHLDTWDMKPQAGSDVRGQFHPIATSTPGIECCEHLPRLARQTQRMAIVRSVHHRAPSHRSAAYWNLTGHEPPRLNANWQATRKDWPCIGSMVAQARDRSGRHEGPLPGSICLPYPLADGGPANGQDAGFLGLRWDPVLLGPKDGTPYAGVSPQVGTVELGLNGVDQYRFVSRQGLLAALDTSGLHAGDTAGSARYQQQAMDMLLDPDVGQAFDLEREPAALRDRYGRHICGQSALMARKLTEAGVPLVTLYCAAGDLNGSAGAHWDTHANNFNRLKDQMLPPLDQAAAALLDDLADRGRLDETLVVWLTEFGRTPRINGAAGRDHYPDCYSVAFAGGGIQGGQVYGASDRNGAFPVERPCGPADLHATIFHALGIAPHFTLHDMDNRPLDACDGQVLPLFG